MRTKPQRFNPVTYFDQGGNYGSVEANDEGDYVAFEDYDILERELNSANAELELLKAKPIAQYARGISNGTIKDFDPYDPV